LSLLLSVGTAEFDQESVTGGLDCALRLGPVASIGRIPESIGSEANGRALALPLASREPSGRSPSINDRAPVVIDPRRGEA
jgi:hypothetical protein